MKKYNFITAFTMIIGICIGSGIFFKADDILFITNGNIFYGVILFVVGALCVIFCGLSMGNISETVVAENGISSYFEYYFGKRVALAYDRFFKWLYLPSILVVIAWVSGIYLELFIGLEPNFYFQILVGICIFSIIFIINLFSMKLGEYFQNLTTIVKLIPLLIIGVIGFTFPSRESLVINNISNISIILPALLPIAFLFDGWSISTTIANKINNPTKSIKYALSLSPVIILFVYILYFIGITKYIGTETVMSLKNAAVLEAGTRIFGNYGGKLILFIVFLSVVGGINGLVIGFINSNKISIQNPISLRKCFLIFGWFLIHSITIHYQILGNSDVSEISVVFSYFLYALLFIKQWMDLIRQKKFKKSLIPILSTLFCFMLIIASFYVSPTYTMLFFVVCMFVMGTTFI